MAYIANTYKTTTSLEVNVSGLTTSWEQGTRYANWYINGSRVGEVTIPNYASSGGDYEFRNLSPGTEYSIDCDIRWFDPKAQKWITLAYLSAKFETKDLLPYYGVSYTTYENAVFYVEDVTKMKYFRFYIETKGGSKVYDSDDHSRIYIGNNFSFDTLDYNITLYPDTDYVVRVGVYKYSSGSDGTWLDLKEFRTKSIHSFYISDISSDGFTFNVQNIVPQRYYFRFFVMDGTTTIYDNDADRLYRTGDFSYSPPLSSKLVSGKTYQVNVYAYPYAYPDTSHAVKPIAKDVVIPAIQSPYYIFTDGSWKKAIPYIYTATGGWQKTTSYINISTIWKK